VSLGEKWKTSFEYVQKRRKICSPNIAFICNLIEIGEIFSGSSAEATLLFRCSYHAAYDHTRPVLKLCRNLNSRRILVPATSLLCSKGVYVLRAIKGNKHSLFLWKGRLASDSTLEKSIILASMMMRIFSNASNIIKVNEGEETSEFLSFLMNDGPFKLPDDSSATYDDYYDFLPSSEQIEAALYTNMGQRESGNLSNVLYSLGMKPNAPSERIAPASANGNGNGGKEVTQQSFQSIALPQQQRQTSHAAGHETPRSRPTSRERPGLRGNPSSSSLAINIPNASAVRRSSLNNGNNNNDNSETEPMSINLPPPLSRKNSFREDGRETPVINRQELLDRINNIISTADVGNSTASASNSKRFTSMPSISLPTGSGNNSNNSSNENLKDSGHISSASPPRKSGSSPEMNHAQNNRNHNNEVKQQHQQPLQQRPHPPPVIQMPSAPVPVAVANANYNNGIINGGSVRNINILSNNQNNTSDHDMQRKESASKLPPITLNRNVSNPEIPPQSTIFNIHAQKSYVNTSHHNGHSNQSSHIRGQIQVDLNLIVNESNYVEQHNHGNSTPHHHHPNSPPKLNAIVPSVNLSSYDNTNSNANDQSYFNRSGSKTKILPLSEVAVLGNVAGFTPSRPTSAERKSFGVSPRVAPFANSSSHGGGGSIGAAAITSPIKGGDMNSVRQMTNKKIIPLNLSSATATVASDMMLTAHSNPPGSHASTVRDMMLTSERRNLNLPSTTSTSRSNMMDSPAAKASPHPSTNFLKPLLFQLSRKRTSSGNSLRSDDTNDGVSYGAECYEWRAMGIYDDNDLDEVRFFSLILFSFDSFLLFYFVLPE
jgi:hypothetical protein